MKYLINDLPYKPQTAVYYYYDGAIHFGEVTDVILRVSKNHENIEYKIKKWNGNDGTTYHFVGIEKLALDINKLAEIIEKEMESAKELLEEDIFDVDQN